MQIHPMKVLYQNYPPVTHCFQVPQQEATKKINTQTQAQKNV